MTLKTLKKPGKVSQKLLATLCMIHLPVTANLLNNRNPGLLGYKIFCAVWYLILITVQMMSVFVVTVLSVTRTIVIVFPFYQIRKKTVFMSILLVLFYTSLWNSYFLATGEYYYSRGFSSCGLDSDDNFIHHLYSLNFSVCFCLVPVIVFVTMIIAILNMKASTQITASQINRQKVSTTIICFSAVFLVCNFLTFLNMALHTYSYFV